MIYDIQCKNDMLSGAVLIAKIPEDDLDKKALYTIQEDKPDFILPFHHRVVDGQIEFTYQVGTQSKLQYLAGNRFPKDYTELWSSVLSPLFDCGDWFLKPYSFVLDIKHLYCDKSRNTVGYVYIPSKKDCADYYDLKEMAAEFSKQITVNDHDLENKVLRAIMMDFNPKAFIDMLKAYTTASAPIERISSAPQRNPHKHETLPAFGQDTAKQRENVIGQDTAKQRETGIGQDTVKEKETVIPEQNMRQTRENALGTSGEIIIDFPMSKRAEKKAKEKVKERGNTQRKKEKRMKNQESMGRMSDKKPDALLKENTDAVVKLSAEAGANKRSEPALYPSAMQTYASLEGTPDITQNMSYETGEAWLRLIGSALLPPGIVVAIAEGEVFTIGRYDTAVGTKQSNFEFDRMTKAVSRRHAVIERRIDGYNLIDLASSAGTFVDGQKLPPNTPCKLQPGCRISFGNCGADYIWEQ